MLLLKEPNFTACCTRLPGAVANLCKFITGLGKVTVGLLPFAVLMVHTIEHETVMRGDL